MRRIVLRREQTARGPLISEEPRHFRYVGASHARLMEDNGLCPEEYGNFPRAAPRAVTLPGGRRVAVSHLPCPQEAVEVPEADCLQISGHNDGGFILTTWEAVS